MSNSTHKVEIFRVNHLEKHPNADKLEIMKVFDAYQAVVRIGDFKIGDLAAYVCPDSILPDKPEYAFLKGKLRIKASKLRGIVSQGLVLPAPSGFNEGDDIAEFLGVTHYVPKENASHGSGGGGKQGNRGPEPPIPGSHYDIDSWFRYGSVIQEGELVEITEKIHGTSAKFTYQEGKFWVASRNYYRLHEPDTLYWRVLYNHPWLQKLCKNLAGCVIYGEIFGNIQDLKYGFTQGETFRVFDIWDGKKFLDFDCKIRAIREACKPNLFRRILKKLKIFTYSEKNWKDCYVPILSSDKFQKVAWDLDYEPILYRYSKELVQELMNGQSTFPGANHVREGCVIKLANERWDPRIGRIVLKAVSPDYLERA